MNEVEKAVVDHKYADKSMRKNVAIYKHTKKKRIKDKIFNKLFYAFMKERDVVVTGEVVVRKGQYFLELNKIKKKEVEQ